MTDEAWLIAAQRPEGVEYFRFATADEARQQHEAQGPRRVRDLYAFTADVLEAARFARREDAEGAIATFEFPASVSAVAHQF